MALVVKDRVKETTTTTGTGTYTLAGAVTGFEAFSSVGDGNTTYYCCTDGTDFEVGIGTYTASGTTLARTTILQSSNSDSAVNWTSGTRDIFVTQPADKAVFLDGSGNINVTGTVTDDGATHDGDVTFTGASYNVVWDKSDNAFELADNAKLKFGAGDDMEIYSDGTYGRIDVNNLVIRGDDTDNKPALYFQDYNTSDVVDYDTSTSFYFQGPNDAGEQVTYNTIHSIKLDVSDGTEDGRLQFTQLGAGASETTFIFDASYFLLMSEQQLAWYQYNGSYTTYLNPLTPTANRYIKLPDRDGLVRVVASQTMTANLAVGWHTIAVFQGRDDSPGGANQRFHAKFSLADVTSSRHQALTFYAQHIFGQDDGLQVIGNSTFGTDVVTAIRIKSSTDSGNGLYAGAAIQVYVADATNNLILYLDEANLDDSPNGSSYGNVILKAGVADASDPGDVGYSTAGYSTFAEDVQIAINSIEPGGIGVTGNLLTQSNIVLEGATADAHETIITATDATADRTITLPDASGEAVVTDSSGVTALTSTTDGGAILKLVSDDPSDATDWHVENEIQFFAENDASESTQYARIRLYTADVSDGSEDGWLYFGQMYNGTLSNRFAMAPHGKFYLLSGGANDPVIEWNATKGTSYDVQLKTATPTADRTITLPDATGEVVTKDSSDVVTITSTADGGPTLDLKSDDHSDASDFATEGKIRFYADNDANEQVVYNQITSITADVTDGTEDGWLYFGNMVNGTLTNAFAAANKSLYFVQDDSTIQFRAWGGTAYHVTVTPSTPTADRTITLPDATGEVVIKDSSDTVTITSTDDGASDGPVLDIYRNSASPAVSDYVGTIQFSGENDADQKLQYAEIQAQITDETDGTEDGALFFQTRKGGSLTSFMTLSGSSGRVNILNSDLFLNTSADIIFEGATSNANETTLTVTDPTADRTITLPDATGTVGELLIASGSVSDVSSLDFDSSVVTGFKGYRLELTNVIPATDNVDAYLRLGTSNSADSGSTDYGQVDYIYGVYNVNSRSGPAIYAFNKTYIELAYSYGALGTGTGENAHFHINLPNGGSSGTYKHIQLLPNIYSYYPILYGQRIHGAIYRNTNPINYISMYLESGNIASADYRLFGEVG